LAHLAENPGSVHAARRGADTALARCRCARCTLLVQALLAKGADVSAKTTKGETALTMAQDEKIKAAVLNGGAP